MGVVLTDGHMVVNILLMHAPDKGDALLSLLQDCDVANALVVGDDDNDEAAFEKSTSTSGDCANKTAKHAYVCKVQAPWPVSA